MNKTKIICTMGPASDDVSTIKSMIEKGMNIARFNFSHGTHEEHLVRVNRIKEIREELGVNIGILQDTKGPEIRLGVFETGKVELVDGDIFTLTTKDIIGNKDICSITYKGLVNDVKQNTSISMNDGLVELKVLEVDDENIKCEIVHGGKISNRKAINVPSIHLSMPFLSEVDKKDLEFGATVQYDYLALSFVRNAQDVLDAKEYAAKFNYYPFIISKIENQEGIDNLDEIIDVSDGIMVARGDMGVEIPFELVPQAQQEMINKCLAKGKVVIVATNMLESMCENPRATRAEVNDVASAVYQGTTCTMLSGESAAGKFPINAVDTMAKINKTSENYIQRHAFRKGLIENHSDNLSYNLVSSAISLSESIKAKAIVCLSLSGKTIKTVSAFRPDIPIIGCTTNEQSYRKASILYGVSSLLVKEEKDEEVLIKNVLDTCIEKDLLNKDDVVVFIAGLPLGKSGLTNMIKVVQV